MNLGDKIFTWGSEKVTPKWCQTPGHWSSRFSGYFFVDCPCCIFFRGLVIGSIPSFVMAAILAFVLSGCAYQRDDGAGYLYKGVRKVLVDK